MERRRGDGKIGEGSQTEENTRLLGMEEAEVELGVACMEGSPFVVGHGAEDGVGDRGWGLVEAIELLAELGEGLIEGDVVGTRGAAGDVWDFDADGELAVEVFVLHELEDELDEPGRVAEAARVAVVGVGDPVGEVGEVLAWGPVAAGAEGARAVGGFEGGEVGTEIGEGLELERSAVGDGFGVDGHG